MASREKVAKDKDETVKDSEENNSNNNNSKPLAISCLLVFAM